MGIIKNVAWFVFEFWRVTKRERNALTFCFLVLVAAPISAICWTVENESATLGAVVAIAYVFYVFVLAPRLEHPIATGLRMHDFHEGLLGGANGLLLLIVGACLPPMVDAVGALWFAFLLALVGLI